METYCVSCKKKNTANKNSSVRKTKENALMLLSTCAASGKRKSIFIKIKGLQIFQIISLKLIKSLTNFY